GGRRSRAEVTEGRDELADAEGRPGLAAKPAWLAGWTGEHVRHAATMIRQGANPAAQVYESIGADFFLALAPGWLNLGLWQGPGSEDAAEDACRRLVTTLASALPAGGVVLDVGNGLAARARGARPPPAAGHAPPLRLGRAPRSGAPASSTPGCPVRSGRNRHGECARPAGSAGLVVEEPKGDGREQRRAEDVVVGQAGQD